MRGNRYSQGAKYRGRGLRPEGPNIEDRRAECGGGVLGEGAAIAPYYPVRGSGERCKLPQGVCSGAPAEIEFGAF